jgi:membrane fusion protein, multidrug efflux system
MSEVQNRGAEKPPRKRRAGWILAAIALALVVVVLIHILTRKPPARGTPPQVVKVAQAVNGEMPVTLNELGTVTPTATVTVLPQLSGYLTELGYKEGQEVKKGQFLAQIDPRQYQVDLEQAQASLAKDQATLGQAKADLARYVQLRAQKAIAEQTVVDQEYAVKEDEAQVQVDQANIDQYVLDLAYCHITSPVDGRVGLRLVDPGNYVTASSSTGIAVITTIKPTTVEFNVAQDDLGPLIQRFNSGANLPVTAYSSDNNQSLATGTLYAISNQMATATGTVTLRANFANDNEALFPNEFVNVQILVNTLKPVVVVPTPAVLNGAKGDYVYLVNADHTVSVHFVKLGPSNGPKTAVTSGLQAGATVVIDGTDRLSDGARIALASDTPAAADSTRGAGQQKHERKKKSDSGSGSQESDAGK